ncbi:hypothetical protein P9597_02435 [Aneurinibacillus migulanus]|uniref:hypothetical protein n=1 Tax=Aneurinibacillus migulanus TaxID=47500 RepID=UPI002E22F322|nr:hypothetical protein [Aneurinibacillus migulanus]
MKPHERIEAEIMNDQLQKNVPAILGAYPTIAQLTKVYYDELVKQGFTKKQALHIVAEQGFTAGYKGGNE